MWKCHFLLTNCKYFLIKTFPSFANKDFDRSICAIKSRRFWQLVHQRVYLEPCQTSLMPLFGKVVILFTNFAKKLHHSTLLARPPTVTDVSTFQLSFITQFPTETHSLVLGNLLEASVTSRHFEDQRDLVKQILCERKVESSEETLIFSGNNNQLASRTKKRQYNEIRKY